MVAAAVVAAVVAATGRSSTTAPIDKNAKGKKRMPSNARDGRLSEVRVRSPALQPLPSSSPLRTVPVSVARTTATSTVQTATTSNGTGSALTEEFDDEFIDFDNVVDDGGWEGGGDEEAATATTAAATTAAATGTTVISWKWFTPLPSAA